jgi:hypothetical protein
MARDSHLSLRRKARWCQLQDRTLSKPPHLALKEKRFCQRPKGRLRQLSGPVIIRHAEYSG